MAAAIGVLSTFGIVLPDGAEAQSSQRTQSVEISELVGAAGEYVKADPLHAKKTDVTVTYVASRCMPL
ncbi:hypothetical protein [Verrucomicrobium spinosum]|uniref:hypothetical protein n=1 Tax=Verrucomicrobium spinosum TaxID=2736 RepID=UPI0009463249|nr:hypothetical protein [Verrucomicrobium spinosum]